ncbi:MAG TPA: hypothetical protein PLY93_01045 [Turneriella sp.]|nr:hypothetical protein [Turneriella sp.]
MNETDFQALFNAYRTAALAQKENPVPPALHLMVYNYARIRHQQSSDVSGDFYLHVSNKLEGILHRYDASLLPFYQYMAQTLNFEFGHFLRRRKLPRSQIRLQSIEELREKRVELFENTDAASLTKEDILDAVIQSVPLKNQKYAKIALALPLTYADLRAIIHKQQNNKNTAWQLLRAYREYLHFIEKKRHETQRKRDRLIETLMHLAHELTTASGKTRTRLTQRKDATEKKFFSIDTRIPIRIVAATMGDSIATAQRQLKSAVIALRKAWLQREKQKLDTKK